MKYELFDRPLVNWSALPPSASVFDFEYTSPDAMGRCLEALGGQGYDRERLAAVLHDYNTQIGNDGAALANIELLRRPDAAAVVTGQQAGLFTGPLYTIYKAATAIVLARQQSQRLGVPVVPIYWNATEDHDLSEIAFCSLPGKRWEAEFGTIRVAAEALSVMPAVAEVIPQFTNSLPELYRSALAELLAFETDDYGCYSSSVVARLFAGTGLIIVEPRLLRPMNVAFFQQCVEHRAGIRTALLSGAKVLKTAGIDPSFTPGSGFGLFHIADSGQRGQVQEENGGFRVGTEILDEAALLNMIALHPQSFSTGAYLRPILQSLTIPNLAFVAGPGEIRYHMQLRELYRLFDAVIPVMRPRNHATMLGRGEERSVEKLGLTHSDLFRGPNALRRPLELPEVEAAPFDRAGDLLRQAVGVLAQDGAGLVGERAIDTFRHKAEAELAKVRKRAAREYQRQGEVDNARIDRLFATVLPAGTLQERRINIFHFLGQVGPTLLPQILDAFDPDEERHYIFLINE